MLVLSQEGHTLSACQAINLHDVGPSQARIGIGGVVVGIRVPPEDCSLPGGLLDPFLVSEVADIEVNVTWQDTMSVAKRTPTFASGALWSFFDEDDFVYDFVNPKLSGTPYKRLRIKRSFDSAELALNRALMARFAPVSPLEYPADELLFTNYLAHRGIGVEVHGCAVVEPDGRSFLFLGHSGAGKSTTARLWDSLRAAQILSDDRIILRFHDDELWMYGTPWHGEGQFASANKARVGQIFILQHGAANRFVPLSRSRAVGELFARSFPPFHSPEGLERTMEFLSSVAAAVPCYQFEFTPDVRSLDRVLGFHG